MDNLYKLNYGTDTLTCKLDDYENVNISEYIVFESIDDLVRSNPTIQTDDNVIVHIVNGISGFGSQISVFMQILHYFNKFYPKIVCLPHFSRNNENFKYHDSNYNNSFFLYYKKKVAINDLHTYKQYVLQSNVINAYPFFLNTATIREYPANEYIHLFVENYEIAKNQNTLNIMNEIKCKNVPLFGIHIRCSIQKRIHDINYLSISIKDRLNALKEKIDKTHTDYSIFVMSDVQPYIEMASSIFKTVYYFENIKRIDNDYVDIISSLNYNECGHKLGMDILTECFAMSMCDKIFVSNSNIPILISTITPNIELEEY